RQPSDHYSPSHLWDDGIQDPTDTRNALAITLSEVLNASIDQPNSGVLRLGRDQATREQGTRRAASGRPRAELTAHRARPGPPARAQTRSAGEISRLRESIRASLQRELASRSKDGSSARPTDQAVGLPRPKDIAFGNYYALVIGSDQSRQLPRLPTAVNDARDIDRTLKARYGFKVTLLLDANRYQILSALNGLRERLTDKDNLFIYYAGHGELDRKNQRGHWLPIDAEPNSSATWISNIAVTDILNAMNV